MSEVTPGRTVADLSDEEIVAAFDGQAMFISGAEADAISGEVWDFAALAADRPADPSERAFTLPDFDRLTPDLSGSERLSVFLGLPVQMRDEAWRELGERIERGGRARWAEERLGPCTPQELADEIAAIWGECRKVPLGFVGEPSRAAGTRRPTAIDRDRDLDVLDEISPREYVEALTGSHIPPSGVIVCPLPDHDERTPSFQVYEDPGRGWFCFGCSRGGTIYDLGATLYGIEPRGRGFHDLRRRLAAELIGWATA